MRLSLPSSGGSIRPAVMRVFLGVVGLALVCPHQAWSQLMLVPKKATPVTAEDRAKMDKFVGFWRAPRGKMLPADLVAGPSGRAREELITGLLQPWAKERQETTEWDIDDTGAVCKQDGRFRAANDAATIVRSKDKLVMVGNEQVPSRDIFMNSPHPADLLPTWNGDSRGHFEGDMLVIDTIGYNDETWLGSDREPHTEELHVIDFLTLHDDNQYIEDRVIVDDRKALTAPFTYTLVWKLQPPTPNSDANAGPVPVRGLGSEQICNQERFGHDPWRRKREGLLQEHQDVLDAFIQQTLEKK